MAPNPLRHPGDRAPALVALLWERYGVLPRNMIFVEVTHPKVPYIHDNRYHVTVFDRDAAAAASSASSCASASWRSRTSSAFSRTWRATSEIDLPTDPGQWIVHVAHENLLPSRRMSAAQAPALPLVPVPAPRLAARLLRLWPRRRSAAVGRDHAGEGAVGPVQATASPVIASGAKQSSDRDGGRLARRRNFRIVEPGRGRNRARRRSRSRLAASGAMVCFEWLA